MMKVIIFSQTLPPDPSLTAEQQLLWTERFPATGRAMVMVPDVAQKPGEPDAAYLQRVAVQSRGADLTRSALDTIAEGGDVVAFLHRVAAASQATIKGVPYRVVDAAELPARDGLRDAWTVDATGKIVTDMPCARKIRHRQLLALQRSYLDAMRNSIDAADDANNGQQMAQLKQRRRAARELNLETKLAAITTPAELAAYVPQELMP